MPRTSRKHRKPTITFLNVNTERISIMSMCKMVGVKIQSAEPHPLIVLGVSRPTNGKSDYTNFMCDAISSIARTFPNSPLWIAGDTNLPDVDSQTITILKYQYAKHINELFINTFATLGLSQMVTFPTRLNKTLDVFLTNQPSLVNWCEPISEVSDHDVEVYVNSDIMPRRQRPVQRKIHIWKKADTGLSKEDVAAFAEETQIQHNPDTPVETLGALFTAKWPITIQQNCLPSATTSPVPRARSETCLERKRNITRRPSAPSLIRTWQSAGLQRILSNQNGVLPIHQLQDKRKYPEWGQSEEVLVFHQKLAKRPHWSSSTEEEWHCQQQ